MIMYTGGWCNHGDDNEDDKRAMGVGGGGEMGGVLNVPFFITFRCSLFIRFTP